MNRPTNQHGQPSEKVAAARPVAAPVVTGASLNANAPMIITVKELCGSCYACVRECPAKAIRIEDQKADILPNRCIACGNCLKVCRRAARRVSTDLPRVHGLLKSREHTLVALLDPAFPAEFSDDNPHVLCDQLRSLGFRFVHKAAFGADLVGHAYRRLLKQHPHKQFIASTCPAVVSFIERYQPELVEHLAPVVSPMIAAARATRRMYGDAIRVVYFSPCIAKKAEARDPRVAGAIDCVLTFDELRLLLDVKNAAMHSAEVHRASGGCGDCGFRDDDIHDHPDFFRHDCAAPASRTPSERVAYGETPSAFDAPLGGRGSLSPLPGALLRAAGLSPEAGSTDGLVAAGRNEFLEALREFAAGHLNARLLEVRSCSSCVDGCGVTTDMPSLRRRSRIIAFPRREAQDGVGETVESPRFRHLLDADALDLTCTFSPNDQRIAPPSEARLRSILAEMGKHDVEDESNCGACGYATCREHAIAIHKGLAEPAMCLPFTIRQLRRTCFELQKSNRELASTQEALMQAEKLASMGQLAAGIVHEVNNPLSTVLMLAHVLLEEVPVSDPKHEDLQLIVRETTRCKGIVSSLLRFARANRVDASRVNVADLTNQVIQNLQYLDHHTRIEFEVDADDVTAEVDREQFVQVLTNLASNAIDAMPEGGTLTFSIAGDQQFLRIRVSDTGMGIPPEIYRKVFEPFFTTKKPGEGTGLGLAVTYGIVKMHHGHIEVKSNADPTRGPTGTTFLIEIPRERASIAERGGGWPTPVELGGDFDSIPDTVFGGESGSEALADEPAPDDGRATSASGGAGPLAMASDGVPRFAPGFDEVST